MFRGGGGTVGGAACNVLRRMPAGRKGSIKDCSFSGSFILGMWELLQLLKGGGQRIGVCPLQVTKHQQTWLQSQRFMTPSAKIPGDVPFQSWWIQEYNQLPWLGRVALQFVVPLTLSFWSQDGCSIALNDMTTLKGRKRRGCFSPGSPYYFNQEGKAFQELPADFVSAFKPGVESCVTYCPSNPAGQRGLMHWMMGLAWSGVSTLFLRSLTVTLLALWATVSVP